MSTPTPSTPSPAEPTAATVVTDVHQVLDTAKQQATDALSAVEHLDWAAVADEAKQAVHDAIDLVKAKVAGLFGHGQPAAPSTSSTPSA